MSENSQTHVALVSGAFGYGLASITGLLTANGGAAVVVMSLIGTVWGHCTQGEGRALAASLASPLWYFGFGVFLAIGTAMASFLSQGIIVEGRWKKVARPSQILACGLGLLSLGSLVVGMWVASRIIGSTG